METRPAPASQEAQDHPLYEMTPEEERAVGVLVDVRGLSYFEAIARVCGLSVAEEYHKRLEDIAKPRTTEKPENPATKYVTGIIEAMNARNASRLDPDGISPVQFAALVQAAKDRRGKG